MAAAGIPALNHFENFYVVPQNHTHFHQNEFGPHYQAVVPYRLVQVSCNIYKVSTLYFLTQHNLTTKSM